MFKRTVSRWHPAVVAGAVWAGVAVRLVRRRLKKHGLAARVPPPPPLGHRGTRGVRAALRRLSPTCLERALVEQTWLSSLGMMRDIVIGVPPEGMKQAPAHAWVDGSDPKAPDSFLELHRIPPRPRRVAVAPPPADHGDC